MPPKATSTSFHSNQSTLTLCGCPGAPLPVWREKKKNGLKVKGRHEHGKCEEACCLCFCPACCDKGYSCSTLGWGVQLSTCSQATERLLPDSSVHRAAVVRRLTCRLTRLPGRCFQKQMTLDNSLSSPYGFLGIYFTWNSAYTGYLYPRNRRLRENLIINTWNNLPTLGHHKDTTSQYFSRLRWQVFI